jgi:hypothetical protein
MKTRIGILLDRDYRRIVPGDRLNPQMELLKSSLTVWNWKEKFELTMDDCQLQWVAPGIPHRPPLGVISFQWNPPEGEIIDATAFVLPGTDLKQETKFLTRMGIEKAVQDALGPRPQVFIVTQSSRLLRCPVAAHDGNNKMMTKEQILEYVLSTLGVMGLVALHQVWKIDVFKD